MDDPQTYKKLAETTEEIKKMKKSSSETSEEIKKMKMSSATNQNEIREMSNEFTDITDEVRAFKEEVFDRCEDYVRHATNLEQRVINLNKQEEVNIKTIQEIKSEVMESIDYQDQAVAVYATNMKIILIKQPHGC